MARAKKTKKPARKASSKKSKTTRKASAKKPAAKKQAAKPVVKKVQKCTTPKNTTSKAYTQSEFIQNVQAYCGLESKAQAKELCEDIQCLLTHCLKKGYKVPLMGLGKLYVRKTKARIGRNPATGEQIQIPARKKVRFSVAKSLREAVL